VDVGVNPCPTPLMTEFSSSSFSTGNAAIVRHAADSTLDRPFQRRGSHRKRFCVADRSLPLSFSLSLSHSHSHSFFCDVSRVNTSAYNAAYKARMPSRMPLSLSLFSTNTGERLRANQQEVGSRVGVGRYVPATHISRNFLPLFAVPSGRHSR